MQLQLWEKGCSCMQGALEIRTDFRVKDQRGQSTSNQYFPEDIPFNTRSLRVLMASVWGWHFCVITGARGQLCIGEQNICTSCRNVFAYFEHSKFFLAMNNNNRINHHTVCREGLFFQPEQTIKKKDSLSCAMHKRFLHIYIRRLTTSILIFEVCVRKAS